MDSLRLTNWLLLVIALALVAHLGWVLLNSPVGAETFRLDSCITDSPADRPANYLHVVPHDMTEP